VIVPSLVGCMDAKVDDPPSSECVGVPGGPSPQNGTFSDDLQQRKIDEVRADPVNR
jgi:hypothetical protein